MTSIAPHDSVERYTSLGVDVIKGEAEILTPNKVRVNGKDLTARSIVIAAGGEPFVPPIKGIELVDYLTSDTVWGLRTQPKSMVMLGGGPIGCELAQAFARLGTRVTIVEMLPRMLIREDAEYAERMSEVFRGEGIDVLTGHRAQEMLVDGERLTLVCDRDGERVEIDFDRILIAVGRAARVSGYGLENIDVTVGGNGTIEANAYLQAGHPNVYAVGDVVGPYQFTHAASHQAWYAAANALFAPFKKFKADYSVLPWATYTDPEIARVGVNETEAQEQNIPYEVTRYDIGQLDRARTDGHAQGEVKVLTVPGKDRILGVTIISRHAGDLIAEFVLAMRHGLGLNKILGTVHAYPTWMEANKYAAGNWKKDHAPKWALDWLEKFHRWRRGGS